MLKFTLFRSFEDVKYDLISGCLLHIAKFSGAAAREAGSCCNCLLPMCYDFEEMSFVISLFKCVLKQLGGLSIP